MLLLAAGRGLAAESALEPAPKQENSMQRAGHHDDRQLITDHIHGLFRAYIRKDRDAIRHGHTADWRGFQLRSDHIVRGIDEYMIVADQVLKTMNGIRYEIQDIEIHPFGDIAIVYYRAGYWIRNSEGLEVEVPLRSVDIYRRDRDGWNQCGSNICTVPPPVERPADSGEPPVRGTIAPGQVTPLELDAKQRARLLADREAVWRAFFSNDRTQLEQLLPEETIGVNAQQEPWLDRDGILRAAADIAASGAKLLSLAFPKTEIQCYGDVAILYTMYRYETEVDGKRSLCQGRGTEIFLRQDDGWVNSGWHLDSGH
jgi:ketosteroid isomerase-like protein